MADAQIRITADTSQAERALGNLNNTIRGLASVVIGAGVAKSLVDMASAAQEMTNKLISVSSGVDQANAKFLMLAATAQRTGSNLGGTVDLFQKLAQSEVLAGSSSEALTKITENFNKTLQISGASGAGAAAALYQFAQAMQKGTLNGDEFRTIQETNGYMLRILQKELGKTATELRQMATDGKLSAEILAKALYNSNQIAEDYGKTIRTIPQALENLKTSAMTTFKVFDDATGFSRALVAALELLANNLDIIVSATAGLAAAFVAINFGAIIAGVRSLAVAMVGLGTVMGPIGVAAAAIAGIGTYLAMNKVIEDAKKKTEELNNEQDKGLKLTHQRNQQALDLDKTLKQQIGTLRETNNIEARATPIKSLQLEIEKALAVEREKYKKTGEAMLPQMERELATETRRKILNDERLSVDRQILDIKASTNSLAIMDANESAVALDMERFRLSVTQETYNLRSREIEQVTRLNKEMAAGRDIARANQDAMGRIGVSGIVDPRTAAIEETIFTRRQQYGTAYTKELEAQDRITQNTLFNLQQQANVTKILGDLTREMTPTETAQRAGSMFGGTREGIETDIQRQMKAVDLLRSQGLISQQSYADQSVLIEKTKLDNILQLEQKNSEARLRINGVTNDAIIKAVQDQQKNVQMIQQGGIQGFQGVLGALSNVFSSMGAQNKKAFEAHKTLAVAQALISTYQAAAQAIAFPPGPPLSFIYVAGAIAAGMAQVNAIRSQQYSGRALGGPVMGGTSYIVGERGPELFTPSQTGNITRNDQLGGGSTNVNFTIVANDASSFDDLLIQRRGMITQMVSDAMLERGHRSMV